MGHTHADTVNVVAPQTTSGTDGLDPRVQRSRAAVLAATLELLAHRGIAGTTIEAVAQRSGIAKTTIYRQWSSQAELVLDTFAGLLHPPADPDTGTLDGDLLDLVTGLARSASSGPAAALMFALVDAAERDPAFAALHRREAAARHAVVLAVITRGIRRGELPADTDPAEVLDLIAGPIFHRRAVTGGTIDAGFAARVVDRVLTGYRGITTSHR
jgi:AcrR family transcriptional regulator